MIRFIILASARTGTTVVGNALADHPSVLYFGELFHYLFARRVEEAARATIGAGVARGLPGGLPACREDDDGAAYVRSVLARSAPGVTAVGFKIFYAQAREGRNASAWDCLAADRELRIVHIRRDNWLESLVSQERAARTNVWHAHDAPDSAPFAIDPVRCERFFERKARALAASAPLLATHAALEVEYGEITGDFQGCMARICRFLEVDPALAGGARLAKIARRPLSQELTNFEALRRHFGGTPYERFFARGSP